MSNWIQIYSSFSIKERTVSTQSLYTGIDTNIQRPKCSTKQDLDFFFSPPKEAGIATMKIKSKIYEVHLHRNILGWKLKVDESFSTRNQLGDICYKLLQGREIDSTIYEICCTLYLWGHYSLHIHSIITEHSTKADQCGFWFN